MFTSYTQYRLFYLVFFFYYYSIYSCLDSKTATLLMIAYWPKHSYRDIWLTKMQDNEAASIFMMIRNTKLVRFVHLHAHLPSQDVTLAGYELRYSHVGMK